MTIKKSRSIFRLFQDSNVDVFSISHINILIGLISCIFGLVNLIRSIQGFLVVGEADPDILYMFMPIPLSDLVTDTIESIILLFSGITLLLRKSITIRFYTLYCILQLLGGFELASNNHFILTGRIYYFFSTTSIFSILLLFYFNNSRVISELNLLRRLKAKEYLLYIILGLLIIFLAYYYRSIIFESYSMGIFRKYR